MNSVCVITSKRVLASVAVSGDHMREPSAENVLKTSNSGRVKFLDTIERVDPFNPSCSAEIFEIQHVRLAGCSV